MFITMSYSGLIDCDAMIDSKKPLEMVILSINFFRQITTHYDFSGQTSTMKIVTIRPKVFFLSFTDQCNNF